MDVKRKRPERISETAVRNGDYVIDLFQHQMFTAPDISHSQYIFSNNLYPIYDARSGKGVGKMKPNDFVRKILGDSI